MHRAFALDVLVCPNCGGRMRLVGTLHDPAAIRRILAHLGLSHAGQSSGPAPPARSAAARSGPWTSVAGVFGRGRRDRHAAWEAVTFYGEIKRGQRPLPLAPTLR